MRVLFTAVCAALFVTSPIHAQFTTYANRASFEAQLGATVVDDYSNPDYIFLQTDAAMSSVLNETRYTTTGFTNNNLVFSGFYCAGCNGSYRMDFRSTSVTTDGQGVYGVGFDFFNFGSSAFFPGPLFSAFITFGDATTESILLQSATSTTAFFAVTSTRLIATIHLGLADGGSLQSGSFLQDNLTIGTLGTSSVVPEPGAVLLLAAGLAGLAIAGKARRKRA